MIQEDLKVGDKVYYKPSYFSEKEFENGIVKEIPKHTKDAVRVVFNCGGDWKNFQDYTSCLTNLTDLNIGWKSDKYSKNINNINYV